MTSGVVPDPVMRVEGLVRKYKQSPGEMTSPITATDDLFVLAHLGLPAIDGSQWTMDTGGLVDRPATWSVAITVAA